jgi:hypothetical protein
MRSKPLKALSGAVAGAKCFEPRRAFFLTLVELMAGTK